jgi:hypothetical protein
VFGALGCLLLFMPRNKPHVSFFRSGQHSDDSMSNASMHIIGNNLLHEWIWYLPIVVLPL